jgi:hypothetical protein
LYVLSTLLQVRWKSVIATLFQCDHGCIPWVHHSPPYLAAKVLNDRRCPPAHAAITLILTAVAVVLALPAAAFRLYKLPELTWFTCNAEHLAWMHVAVSTGVFAGPQQIPEGWLKP